MKNFLSGSAWHWLPALFPAVAIAISHRDVPYHDQWDLLPLLDLWFQHKLTLADLLAPHNGHVLFLPRLVMLILAALTQWNTLAEVIFGFTCMLLNSVLLLGMARSIAFDNHTAQHDFSVAQTLTMTLLIFTLAQAQNWLWGWQLQIPLALMCVLLGLRVLSSKLHDVLALTLAAIAMLAASVSFAGGLLGWLAALPILWQRRPALLALWLLPCSITIAFYRQSLGESSSSIPLPAFAQLPNVAFSTLTCLGSSVAGMHERLSAMAALAGLAALWPARRLTAKSKAQLLALLLFCLGNAVLIAVIRGEMGIGQMLASRYITLTLPFWLVILALWLPRLRHKTTLRTAVVVCTLLVAGTAAQSYYSVHEWRQLHKRLQLGAMALSDPYSENGQKWLAAINPRADKTQALREVEMLAFYRLSFYRQLDTPIPAP